MFSSHAPFTTNKLQVSISKPKLRAWGDLLQGRQSSGRWGSEILGVQPLLLVGQAGGRGGCSGQEPLPQSCHLLEPAGGGGEAEPGLAGARGREASRAAGRPEKWVQPGAGTMPLQDDTLREVWASDRSGKPPPHPT